MGTARDATTGHPAGEARDTAALLMHVTELTRANFEAAAASFELTTAQARALLALEAAAPMRSLAEHLRCDASYVTGIADRLEGRGLVARATREGDRRVKLLELTDAGRRTRDALQAAMLESSPVMVALDADERHLLRTLLAKAGTAQRVQ
ncbi:MarR family winged helix-turn-helix transcriptional regulator [Blastococcus xanthinilyticus]|uniref:DNA-binding MarR family transcriptional regulator n=1 Tax=Blastococcus xanthinilyticus TaxID=1564164 RepID=A0A5S5CRF0_9ACTN|nr:MarR family transcriptional regulator [Blastococcus xanthinilyticus]TYP84905.1 DNA-binding MarR family transcriptional regulator [Blastococcus xanthinilyticus]